MRCHNRVYTGPRAGRTCGFKTSVVIATRAYTEQVCGYHARQYTPDCQYPLSWNLVRIRQQQRGNLQRHIDFSAMMDRIQRDARA